MKKLILLLVGAALSIAVANGQTDTTKTKSTGKATTQSASQSYPTKDMKKVSPSEIPASLRTTLQAPEYKGWENGTVYYNSVTKEYALQSPQASGTTSATTGKKDNTTWHRFDSNGKRIPDIKE